VTYDIRSFAKEFSYLKNGETEKSKSMQVAGRVYVKRSAGTKLYFYDLGSDVSSPSSSFHTIRIPFMGLATSGPQY
jgi:lysyl-tRNA synthetase class II